MHDDTVLRQLADRREIGQLTAHYCDRLDAHDIDAVGDCFTIGAQADYGPGRGGVVSGRAAIRDRIARGQSAFRRTHHQLGHQTIELDGDQAHAVSAAITWHERFDGDQELLALRYVDRFERTDHGWLIARRRVEISMVQGFEGTEWHWWERRPPSFPAEPSSADRPRSTE